MSERALLLVGALLLAPRAGVAQNIPQLEHRLRVLEARRLAVVDSIQRRDELGFQSQAREMVTAGPFTIAYPVWAANSARASLPTVLPVWREHFGVALDSLPLDTLVIELGEKTPGVFAMGQWRLGAMHSEFSTILGPDAPIDWTTAIPTGALDLWARTQIDTTMATWLGAGPGIGRLTDFLDGSLGDLVKAPSGVAHRCTESKVEDCLRVLDLAGPADPLVRWYDPADIVAIAIQRSGNIEYSRWTPSLRGCAEGHDFASCRNWLEEAQAASGRPVNDRVRGGLFAFALAAGGDGAFLRVHRAAGLPVAAQLEAAAQLPLDTLVSRWRAAIRLERGQVERGLTTVFLLGALWVVGSILFFAWRFRWRHV